ncbi:MAG: hypothetical protein ACYTKD_25275 [Planctomycetota bacterium]|jgi:Kef-type K+ transport system membrane component KefB
MAERNTEGGRRPRRGVLGKTARILAKGGRYAIHVPLVIAGWLLATAVVSVLLWLTVGLEEGLSIPGVAFVYVLRTILGSLLLALVVLPVAYVLPRRWREKARKLSRRQVAIAIVMCIVIVSVLVLLLAVNAFR